MGSDWTELKLKDACASIDYGLTASANENPVGPKFLRITDIVGGAVDWNNVPFVSVDGNGAAKYRLYDGDIVVARTGASTGESAFIQRPPEAVFASYLVRLKIKGDFDSRFVSYYMKSEQFWAFIRGVLGDKSAQPNASASTMVQAPFCAPKDKDIQAAIGRILGMLDDKIELNRRMNKTLDAMACALFKSWFVDFDPVRAKVEGKCNAHPGSISDVMPNAFVHSARGDIPDGWHVRALYECADYVNGLAFRSDGLTSERVGLPVIKIAELKAGIGNQTKYSSRDVETKYLVTSGDVLFAWSGSPDTSIDTFIWVGPDGLLNQHIFKILFRLPEEKLYVYFLLRFLRPSFIEIARNKQTTGLGHVTVQDLKRINTVFPDYRALSAFNRIIEPLFQRAFRNRLESHTLSAIRNGLLPKLISGELRVNDFRRFIGSEK